MPATVRLNRKTVSMPKGPVALPKGSKTTTANSITDRAMLVGLAIRRWEPWTTDEGVSKQVADDNQVTHGAGKYRKRLLDPKALIRVTTATNAIRAQHYMLTLPWSDEGFRILSAPAYFTYTQKMKALIDEFNAAADEFAEQATYTAHVKEGKARLGKLAKDEDYPAVTDVRKRFRVETPIKGVESAEDFRVSAIGADEVSKVRKDIEVRVQEQLKESMKDPWQRIADVVGKMSEKLKAYTVGPDGKAQHTFRDSLVGNVAELLDVLPVLNITGDVKLTEFTKKISAALTAHTAEVLRDDATVRRNVADEADKILASIQGFIA